MAPSHAYPVLFQPGDFENVEDYLFTSEEEQTDAPRDVIYCRRCTKSIVSGRICGRPPHRACAFCRSMHQGGCELVDQKVQGRINKIFQLHQKYEQALSSLRGRLDREPLREDVLDDSSAKTAATCLFSAQRTLNRIFMAEEHMAGRHGEQIGAIGPRPCATQDYLAIVLANARPINDFSRSQLGRKRESAETANDMPSVNLVEQNTKRPRTFASTASEPAELSPNDQPQRSRELKRPVGVSEAATGPKACEVIDLTREDRVHIKAETRVPSHDQDAMSADNKQDPTDASERIVNVPDEEDLEMHLQELELQNQMRATELEKLKILRQLRAMRKTD